jgi:hypothetical protein
VRAAEVGVFSLTGMAWKGEMVAGELAGALDCCELAAGKRCGGWIGDDIGRRAAFSKDFQLPLNRLVVKAEAFARGKIKGSESGQA